MKAMKNEDVNRDKNDDDFHHGGGFVADCIN